MQMTPTTTVTILGGVSTTDDHGDVVEGTTEMLTGVPAAIHQRSLTAATESDANAHVVRQYTARLPYGTTVTAAHRLEDEVTGDVYLIDAITTPASAVMPQDVRLDLRRVTT